MIRKYAEIFCWKNVSSFCSAKASHIFSAKNIRILYIDSTKTVNKMTLNELVKLTTLWATGPCMHSLLFWLQTCFFRLQLPQGSYYMSANSKGSGKTALKCRLALAFTGHLCHKYPFLMCSLICGTFFLIFKESRAWHFTWTISTRHVPIIKCQFLFSWEKFKMLFANI